MLIYYRIVKRFKIKINLGDLKMKNEMTKNEMIQEIINLMFGTDIDNVNVNVIEKELGKMKKEDVEKKLMVLTIINEGSTIPETVLEVMPVEGLKAVLDSQIATNKKVADLEEKANKKDKPSTKYENNKVLQKIGKAVLSFDSEDMPVLDEIKIEKEIEEIVKSRKSDLTSNYGKAKRRRLIELLFAGSTRINKETEAEKYKEALKQYQKKYDKKSLSDIEEMETDNIPETWEVEKQKLTDIETTKKSEADNRKEEIKKILLSIFTDETEK